MSTSKHHVSTMYETVPAVIGLNKVQGFDPFKFLHREVSVKTNEEVLKLDLRYKKLWFRLAYPQGRLRLSALRITEQLAIFEAKVFLDRNDSEPIGNFTATCTLEEAPNGLYIKAAQDEALDEALTNAGFDLQFADVNLEKGGSPYERKIPAATITGIQESRSAEPKSGVSDKAAPAENVTAKPEQTKSHNSVLPEEKRGENTADVSRVAAAPPLLVKVVKEPEEGTTSGSTGLVSGSQNTEGNAQKEMELLPTDLMDKEVTGDKERNQMVKAEVIKTLTEPVQTQTASEIIASDNAAPHTEPKSVESNIREMPKNQPAYTADMSVEEIMAKMTLEEAKSVYVDVGTCNGWTIGRVAEERTPSLRWYVYGYKDKNNILRAAAKIMLDSITAQKAG